MLTFPSLTLPVDLALELDDALNILHKSAPIMGEYIAVNSVTDNGAVLPFTSPRILSLQGWPQSGKDVVADYLQAHYQGVGRMAFSDAIIHEVNQYLGEHQINAGNKNEPMYRKILQVWARARRVDDDLYWTYPVQSGLKKLLDDGAQIAIATGMRTVVERDAILAIDGEVWRVIRPANPYTAHDPIEHALDHIEDNHWHCVIVNDVEGDLKAYEAAVERALRSKRSLGMQFSASQSD